MSRINTTSVTIVAIVRVNELHKKFYQAGYDSRDTLGDTLSAVEVNLAIIAACGPALRPLFRKMFPGLFSNKSSNEQYNTPSNYASNYGTGTGRRGTTLNQSFPLKDMHVSKTRTEIRGHSPNESEEEIMTYNGIIRTTAVSRILHDISRQWLIIPGANQVRPSHVGRAGVRD